MYLKLKTEIKEIIDIVNQCPDSLKEKCFELLLSNFLKSQKEDSIIVTEKEINSEKSVSDKGSSEAFSGTAVDTDDICEKDFHVKVQRFLKDNGITMEAINNLYYKENDELKPFYDSLKSTSMQECQLRLAVLTAFENSYTASNGDMTFNCEVIRNRCQVMKCYNSTNFTGYFKSNKNLWETWPEKYDKDFTVSLSSEGKKKLAEVLLALAEGE